jgi:hypothetical protein
LLLAVDSETGSLQFAGYSAVGSWTFADALQRLSRDLNNGGDPYVAAALAH